MIKNYLKTITLAALFIVGASFVPLSQARAISSGKPNLSMVPTPATQAARTPVPTRLIVRYKHGAAHAMAAGATLRRTYKHFPDISVVNLPAGRALSDVITAFRKNPNVLYAEPDYIQHASAIPNDPSWSQQYDMVNIHAPQAWDTQTNSTDVIVAVIDSGIDFTHPDLQANIYTAPDGSQGYDCINDVAGGLDDFGHGSHVAGAIGAVGNNSVGIAGLNWKSSLYAFKFLDANGSGFTSDAITCYDQLLTLKSQGVNFRVANDSWGGSEFDQSLLDVMNTAESSGVLDAVSGSDYGYDLVPFPVYPAASGTSGMIVAGAVDQNDALAYFSSYGPGGIDIMAPGVNTLSTVPTGSCQYCSSTGYLNLSGTSMASPHVAGVAAALTHVNPALTPQQLRDVILDPASYDVPADTMAQLSSTGGRLNFYKALTNPKLHNAFTLNQWPVITGFTNSVASPGGNLQFNGAASDPNGDHLTTESSVFNRDNFISLGAIVGLMELEMDQIMPIPPFSSTSFSLPAPLVSRPETTNYATEVGDGRGGKASAKAYGTVLPTPNPGGPATGPMTVSATKIPAGGTLTATYQVSDPNGPVLLEYILDTKAGPPFFGVICSLFSSCNVFSRLPTGAARVKAYAIDSQLNVTQSPSVVVSVGGSTNTPPLAHATLDSQFGAVPYTVNIDASSSQAFGTTISAYNFTCDLFGTLPISQNGSKASCLYTVPGPQQIQVDVGDKHGQWDSIFMYVTVTPAPISVTMPTLSTVFPSSAPATDGAITVTASGTNFNKVSQVLWNGIPLATSYISNQSLQALVTSDLLATATTSTITVLNAGVGTTSGKSFTVYNSTTVPIVNSISPSSTTAGGAAFTLTLTGTNYVSMSGVMWNGSPRTTSFFSPTKLTTVISASDIATVGVASVTVVTPGVTSSNVVNFFINPPAPLLASLTPSSATAGGAGFNLTVKGSNFAGGAVVNWNGSARVTTLISSTTLTGAILASDITSIGVDTVTVSVPGYGASNALTFNVNPQLPVLINLSKNGIAAGSPSFQLSVSGLNFTKNSVVQWNGFPRTTRYVNTGQVVGTISPSDLLVPTVASVTVYTSSVGVSNALPFTVTALPAISLLEPAQVLAGGPGFSLTVYGNHLTNGFVQWNGQERGTTNISDTELITNISANDIATAGTAVVTVNITGVGKSNSIVYSINPPPPTPTTLAPAFTTVGGSAFTLTINGLNFLSDAVIQWNGASRTTTFVSSTRLTAAIPASDIASIGMATVTVYTPEFGASVGLPFNTVSGTSGLQLINLDPPSIPAGGPTFTLTVNGTGFVSGCHVKWNSSSFATTFVNSNQVTAKVNASYITSLGDIAVTVGNPDRTTSNPVNFSILAPPPPSAYSLNPISAAAGSSDTNVLVTGNNFYIGCVGLWNGTSVASNLNTGTVLNITIPAADLLAPGTGSIQVLCPDGGLTNTLSFPVTGNAPSTSGTGGGTVVQTSAVFNDFAQARVYPNPWRVDRHSALPITFDQLPPGSTVKIFTISGHFVRTFNASSSQVTWDLTNDSGSHVASGVYVYLITNGQGQKLTGQFSVIR